MRLKKMTVRVCALLLAVCLTPGAGALAASGTGPIPTEEPERIPIGGPGDSPTAAPGTAAGPDSAETGLACAVIGEDLTNAQTEDIYAAFGLRRGDVAELGMSSAEERAYLEDYVEDSVLDAAALSCVYVRLLPAGSGTEVSVNNASWCTEDMYLAALAAAGISDIEAAVTAPSTVSGAGALAGIYKAYESLTGRTLDETAKQTGAQMLAAAADLAGQLGELDNTAVVDELKALLEESKDMTDEELGDRIREIAGEYNVTFNDGQVQMLVDLCRQMGALSESELAERIQDLQDTARRIGDLGDKAGEARETIGSVVETVKGYLSRAWEFLSGLFG